MHGTRQANGKLTELIKPTLDASLATVVAISDAADKQMTRALYDKHSSWTDHEGIKGSTLPALITEPEYAAYMPRLNSSTNTYKTAR